MVQSGRDSNLALVGRGLRCFLISFLLASCSGDRSPPAKRPQSVASISPPPGCSDAAKHIAGLDSAERGSRDTALEGRVASNCTANAWSEATRRCVTRAASMDDIVECEREERIRRGDDLGGPECVEVVSHNLALHARRSARPEAVLPAERVALMKFCRARSRSYKECVLMAETLDAYAVCAQRESIR